MAGKYNTKHDQTMLNQVPLENVKDFKYLGSVKTHNGTCSKDIEMRTGMAKNSLDQLNNIWKDHSMTTDLKIMWDMYLWAIDKTMIIVFHS